MDKFDFNGKKVLVTGASSGVGREVAILLSQMGAKVIIVARREEELKKTLSLMEGSGHFYKVLDLSDFEKTEYTIKEIVNVDGKKLDGVAYCAGLGVPVPLRIMTKQKINEIFDVNFLGFAAVLKCVASRKYFNDGGSVLAISSVASSGHIGNDIYSASKGALNSIVLSAAKELRNRKIRINAILPSTINTEMTRNQNLTNVEKYMIDSNEYIMDPKFVASVVVVFLSDSMKYVSGTLLNVDRGDNTWG